MLTLMIFLLAMIYIAGPLILLLPPWALLTIFIVLAGVALLAAAAEMTVQYLTIRIMLDQWRRNKKNK